MPIKILKVSRDELLTHMSSMSQRGFKCVELGGGEYSCSKRINEIQEYVVILLSSTEEGTSPSLHR
jgi:hypothetical protein